MSEVFPDIFGFLSSDPTVGPMVTNTSVSPAVIEIYPEVLDTAARLPALTYKTISLTEEHILEGPSDGLERMRVQIEAWAMTSDDADELCLAVRNLFNGYIGMMGQAQVNVTLHENLLNDYEADRKQYIRIMDFILLYN
jgi:hypothetical protein